MNPPAPLFDAADLAMIETRSAEWPASLRGLIYRFINEVRYYQGRTRALTTRLKVAEDVLRWSDDE